MKSKPFAHRDTLIRFLLWGTVGLILILLYLDTNPIQLEDEELEEPGHEVVLEAVSDFALIIDYGSYADGPSGFQELDFSLAWLNTLQQEVGPASVVDAEQLPEVDLSQFRVVILSRSASANEAWLPKLQGYVDRGGVLVLELPQGTIREAFSADGLGGDRDPQRITHALGLEPSLHSDLEDLPLTTKLVGSSGPLDGAETLLNVDGVPVIYRKRIGAGWAITLDIDYGMLLTAVQQGMPSDEFRVRNRRGSDEVEAADLAPEEILLEINTPLADLLERFLLYGVIESSYPVVGFWPFFEGTSGAFIVTHDENGMGDDAAWMAEFEESFNGTSSYFVRPSGEITTTGLESLDALGVDIGIEWSKADSGAGAYRKMGLLGLEPFERSLNLEAQLALLAERYEHPPLVSSRIRDHLWGRDWAAPFRALHAAGVKVDSSYAPSAGQLGYLFGTGLPFMPIDDTGLGFDLLELPVILRATGAEEERENLERLLTESQTQYHQAITVSFDPDAFVEDPSAHFYRVWRDSYQLAASTEHWITSARNLYRFSRARHNSELRSHTSEGTLKGKEVTILRLETLALESGMYCSVPLHIGERTFSEARRGRNRVEGEELKSKLNDKRVSVMGFQRVLLPLTKGFNAIDVLYE